ncbi:NAD-dependent epimerase/dehydratase family protein [Leifsonia sp. AG29]|uniref:NAD-dependent epimerase/dehydratase family protein n=1 Tax=Leifsonia sp. AG29 TaxID=2598860 RepID=UPI00131CA534|nr:NAD(P)-dependent oxidoreductase [Leifsonia sp. AG29]
MAAKNVIVTGAGGYVGRHVVVALLDAGHRVTAVVRSAARADLDPRAEIVEADILAPGFNVTSLAAERPEVLVHLAWTDGFVHNAPSHMLNLSAHYALLDGAADWGVERIAGLGTMHEIGYWEGAIDADTPTNPSTLYGISKDALRRALFATVAKKTEVAWLRCYYIFGDDRRNHSIFTRLLEAVDAGKSVFPFTTGKNRYDFIDVAELGRQIAVAATAEGVTGTINCSTGNPVSLADQVEAFIRDNDLPIELEYGAFPDRPYDSPGVWGDATRIRELMAVASEA